MMPSDLDNPLKLSCGIILPNRFALAPLTNTQSNLDGTLHDNEFTYLMRRAGRFGLISTCATFVSEEGHAWKGQLGISNDKHLPGLTRLAKAINSTGSVSMVQLHHGGSRADQAPQKISSSAGDHIRAATKDDIQRITKDFVNGAIRAEQAGFNGVEIHGANGYIFTQFLAANINKRTDEYGGPIENRARFLLDTLRAIRKEVSKSFMVNVRISPVDNINQTGLYLADSIKVATWLAENGADVVHLSLRNSRGPGAFEEDKIPVVTAIHENIPHNVKLASAGGIWTREDAEKTKQAGSDIIVLGRASIIHPDWVELSKNSSFRPYMPPWDVSSLQNVSISKNFIEYLKTAHKLVN